MTTYARNVNGVAVDVTMTDPATIFHPDIAAQFVIVPDGTVNGATYIKKAWVNPEPVTVESSPDSEPTYDLLTPMQFYLAFMPTERIAIKASTDPVVAEFWATYQLAGQAGAHIDPNLPSVAGGLTYLATPTAAEPPGAGILASEDRVAQIRAGIAQ